MRKHKRQFGDYEEIALDLRTVKQLLYQADILFHRAAYSDAITAICKRITDKTRTVIVQIAVAVLLFPFFLVYEVVCLWIENGSIKEIA